MSTEAQYWTLQCQFLWFFTAWQKSRRCVQQIVQGACLNPNICFQSERKKQNAIFVFHLKAKVKFCVVYPFFHLKAKMRFCVVYPFFFLLCCICGTATMSCDTRACSFLRGTVHPYLLVAAVLQVVSSHRTICSCFQTPLRNLISVKLSLVLL